MGHLSGARISALLDGQLSDLEAEQAWAHVYACHSCRDHVEREGWVKARLAGLSRGPGAAPEHLRGTLYRLTPAERHAAERRAVTGGLGPTDGERSRTPGAQGRRAAALVGSGAVGAAMLGVLVLGIAPATAPTERRPTERTSQPVATTVPMAPAGPVAVAVSGATAAASSQTPATPTAPTAPTTSSAATGTPTATATP